MVAVNLVEEGSEEMEMDVRSEGDEKGCRVRRVK